MRIDFAVAGFALLVGSIVVGCGGVDDTMGGEDFSSGETGDLAPATLSPKFTALYGDYFGQCKQCHAPGAPGATADIEQSLDFATRSTAFTTLTTRMAMGLVGTQADCNTVPFIVSAQPGASLIVAVVDDATRLTFDSTVSAKCDMDAITDETLKVGAAPSVAFKDALKQWIVDGALDN